MITEKYKTRISMDLTNFSEKTGPLSTYKGGEYGKGVVDYHKVKSVANRFVPAYKTSDTHGMDIYKGVPTVMEYLKPESILDLGCGIGEMLVMMGREDPHAKLFGCTLHVGEVLVAKERYNLPLLAADMRVMDEYFMPNTLDLVVAHASMHFLDEKEQQKCADSVRKIIKDDGHFLVIHYKDPEHYTVRDLLGFKEVKKFSEFIGPAYLYEKADLQ
jgi:ubiquinone/menaquinone biosynthesis C-methylase UbiE